MACVEPASPRFVVDGSGPVETIRIKPQRPIFALLFLPVWLIGWSFGGVAALTEIFRSFQPFLLVWLCFWALA